VVFGNNNVISTGFRKIKRNSVSFGIGTSNLAVKENIKPFKISKLGISQVSINEVGKQINNA
jgi:hypothetical protein